MGPESAGVAAATLVCLDLFLPVAESETGIALLIWEFESRPNEGSSVGLLFVIESGKSDIELSLGCNISGSTLISFELLITLCILLSCFENSNELFSFALASGLSDWSQLMLSFGVGSV